MIWIDYVIISLVLISAMTGLFRGLTKEFFALSTWVTAVWIALTFDQAFADVLNHVFKNDLIVQHAPRIIQHSSVQVFIAFALLFMATFVLGRLLSYLLGEIIKTVGLTVPDRLAGMIFGTGRGLITVLVVVMLAEFLPIPKNTWWQTSFLIPYFKAGAVWLYDYIPSGLMAYVA